MVDLDNSDLDGNANEGDKGDEAEFAAILKTGKTSTLSLHNSFDILNEEDELPFGETRQAKLESNHISNGELFEKPKMIEKGPKDIVNLT